MEICQSFAVSCKGSDTDLCKLPERCKLRTHQSQSVIFLMEALQDFRHRRCDWWRHSPIAPAARGVCQPLLLEANAFVAMKRDGHAGSFGCLKIRLGVMVDLDNQT